MINSEQIQALKAAIDDATQGSWVNESGEGWEAICCDDDQGNAGFIIAEFQGKDATANRKFVQAANPAAIRSLLADRDADKALIAELEKKHCGGSLMEREEHHVGVVNKLLERITELEARTLTVKLPKPHAHLIWIQAGYPPDDYWDDVAVSHSVKDRCCDGSERYPVYSIFEIQEACTAVGITLVVGE
ncbi:MAG: ead/Ea22-like family protein [Enterobacteriaceae bacterium]|nr:ead/Ea22-like family protein [Enterobacteriaceae bacterium]